MIAHAFQFGDDVDCGDDSAQVPGRWLLSRDQPHALLLNVIPPGIDLFVASDHLASQILILISECLNGLLNGHLHHAPQVQDVIAQICQFPVEQRSGLTHFIPSSQSGVATG